MVALARDRVMQSGKFRVGARDLNIAGVVVVLRFRLIGNGGEVAAVDAQPLFRDL